MADPRIVEAIMRQKGIGAPVEFGRPLVPNPDGSVSSELTMTTQGRDGQWYNVPTMMNGMALPPDTVETLFQYGLAPHVGVFPSLESAESAAVRRSQTIRR